MLQVLAFAGQAYAEERARTIQGPTPKLADALVARLSEQAPFPSPNLDLAALGKAQSVAARPCIGPLCAGPRPIPGAGTALASPGGPAFRLGHGVAALAQPHSRPAVAEGCPAPRPEVESLNAYSAPLEGRRGMLRLDFNENTIGPSPKVVEALRAIPGDHIAIYPEYAGLQEEVVSNLADRSAGRPGLEKPLAPEQVGLFNGVDAALHAIFHAYGGPGDQLLTTSPTFGYYTPCAQMQGMTIEAIPYEGPELSFPFLAIRKALIEHRPRILLICNPNNPTGTRLAPGLVLELAAASPETLLVVDELYEAFTGDSVLPVADFAATPNLVVLRSLAKTAGLAGLRMGFAVGAVPVVDRLTRVTGPYDINSFAVTATFAALRDQAYTDDYVAEVLKARDWIAGELKSHGVKAHIDGGNYFLLWPKKDPAEVDAALRTEGILVRAMTGKPLIDGSLRVSLGTTEQMKQFWRAYAKIEGIAI